MSRVCIIEMYTRVRKRLIPISENLPDQADRVLCKMALRVVVKKKKKDQAMG